MALFLGILVGLMILFPPFDSIKEKCKKTLITMEDPEPMADLLLIFEVLILPPIVYESAILLNQSKKVFTNLAMIKDFPQ